jgi:hypothetical protein
MGRGDAAAVYTADPETAAALVAVFGLELVA